MARASLVCRAWRGPAQCILRTFVFVSGVGELERFQRAYTGPAAFMEVASIRELSLQPFDYVDTDGSEDSDSRVESDQLAPLHSLQLDLLPNLRSLYISLGGGAMTDTALSRLLPELGQLQVLVLRNDGSFPGYTDLTNSLTAFLRRHSWLQHLYLQHVRLHTTDALALGALKLDRLKQLALYDCDIKRQALRWLLSATSVRYVLFVFIFAQTLRSTSLFDSLIALYTTFRNRTVIEDVEEGFRTVNPHLRRLVFMNGARYDTYTAGAGAIPIGAPPSDTILPLFQKLRHIWLYDLGVAADTITELHELETFRIYAKAREEFLDILGLADMPNLCYVSIADPDTRALDDMALHTLRSRIVDADFAKTCQIATGYFNERIIYRLFASELPKHDD